MKTQIRGGITAPKGFLAGGVHSGIKNAPILDLALVVSEQSGPIAGVFTTNQLPAAPVLVDRQKLRHRIGQAIIVNSGNANACTGAQGLRDAKEMATITAQHIELSAQQVFVGSTGIIGRPLALSCIRKALPTLVKRLSRRGHRQAAQAIMTTDTKPKEAAASCRIGNTLITIGGMAKGSGMIHPNMATMLAYLTTDIAIEAKALQHALTIAVNRSFNCVSVDGETSTNDTVLLLANGLAHNAPLTRRSTFFPAFQELLNHVCLSLALQICRDGEGLTKMVEILVQGAKSQQDAKWIANSIATSPLVKTAIFGEDPNWGRILAAMGQAGVALTSQTITLHFNDHPLLKNGEGLGPNAEQKIKTIMQKPEYRITITIGNGPGTAHLWTTDLTYDYVKINASYTT
ncbi:MAG: bifunctional glutamate N-acetyltransferase/amino-acid acetyltransferase ArgJ [Nitrospirales bacterium]|nr:bifunctional glutamate N-acetyltransferase/amino-acid acetyltransferase ArgJ [Nitrospirales bacterium]